MAGANRITDRTQAGATTAHVANTRYADGEHSRNQEIFHSRHVNVHVPESRYGVHAACVDDGAP
jgi:hypothetical protein